MLTSTIHPLDPMEEPPGDTFATIIRPHPVIPILVITRILAASINPISHGVEDRLNPLIVYHVTTPVVNRERRHIR